MYPRSRKCSSRPSAPPRPWRRTRGRPMRFRLSPQPELRPRLLQPVPILLPRRRQVLPTAPLVSMQLRLPESVYDDAGKKHHEDLTFRLRPGISLCGVQSLRCATSSQRQQKRVYPEVVMMLSLTGDSTESVSAFSNGSRTFFYWFLSEEASRGDGTRSIGFGGGETRELVFVESEDGGDGAFHVLFSLGLWRSEVVEHQVF